MVLLMIQRLSLDRWRAFVFKKIVIFSKKIMKNWDYLKRVHDQWSRTQWRQLAEKSDHKPILLSPEPSCSNPHFVTKSLWRNRWFAVSWPGSLETFTLRKIGISKWLSFNPALLGFMMFFPTENTHLTTALEGCAVLYSINQGCPNFLRNGLQWLQTLSGSHNQFRPELEKGFLWDLMQKQVEI